MFSVISSGIYQSLQFLFKIVGLLGLVLPLSSSGNTNIQTTLSVVPQQVVVGELITWQVSVELLDNQIGTIQKIESGDSLTWQINGSGNFPITLQTSQVISITAIALKDGIQIPSLVITFEIDGEFFTQLIDASNPVEVLAVADVVSMELHLLNDELPSSGNASYLLEIGNYSPFTITVQINNVGSSPFTGFPAQVAIPSSTVETLNITTTITGTSPIPYLALIYEWDDETPKHSQERITVYSAPIKLPATEPPLILKIIQETGVWFGTLFGALVGFGVTIVKDWLDKHAKRVDDQHQMVSLLQWAIFQAKYASDHDEKVDFQSLETVFKTQSLYIIANRLELIKPSWDLWEAGADFNANINNRHGLQRSAELTSRAERLQNLIDIKGLNKKK